MGMMVRDQYEPCPGYSNYMEEKQSGSRRGKYMKKHYFIPIMMLAMCMTACSTKRTESKDTVPQSETQNESETTETTTTAEKTTVAATTVEETKAETTIEKQVLWDQDGITITATGLDFTNSMWGPGIKLLIENNTEKNLCVQPRNVSVNGYMVDYAMSADVAPGKKANDSLIIENSSISECNIEDIAYIDFSFHIFNNDSWDDFIDTDMIHIETSSMGSYSQVYDVSGEIVYNNNGIKIVSKWISENESYMETSLILYIENKTEDFITVQARYVSVNGFMIEPTFSCDITPGNRAIDGMRFSNSDLEENQIESIDEIELSFHIYDMHGNNTIIDSELITMNFSNVQ